MTYEERAEQLLAEIRRGYWSDPELIELIVKEFDEVEKEVREKLEDGED